MSLGYNVVFRDGFFDVIDLSDGEWIGSFFTLASANDFIDQLLLDEENN